MVNRFDESNFQAEVLGSDLPVLVDFYADWCGPCKMMGPVLDKLAGEYEGRIKVGKVNIDENMELAQQAGVTSIPFMAFYKNGQMVDHVVGAVPKAAMKAKFEANLS